MLKEAGDCIIDSIKKKIPKNICIKKILFPKIFDQVVGWYICIDDWIQTLIKSKSKF